ncbi:MAG TPA: glycogen debranching N-terminal domain-containing protein [Vicinamibacterales bacterium]|nr:glycogen debranching N-terminal domain-containing protein [Vicinamibacterales bacterium]
MKHEPSGRAANEAEPRLSVVLGRGTADVDPHHGQQLVCEGYTVLLSNPDGSVTEKRQGLFEHDTRILSRYQILLDELSPRIDSAGLLDPGNWLARLTVPRPGGDARGPHLPQDSLELTIRRRIGNGMLDDLRVDNHSAIPVSTRLVIKCDADFADIAELGRPPSFLGEIEASTPDGGGDLLFDYRATRGTRSLHRVVRLRVVSSDSEARANRHEIAFDVRIPARGSWRAQVACEALVDDRWLSPVEDRALLESRGRLRSAWQHRRLHIESDPSTFGAVIEQAADDLSALRNWDYDEGADAWIPNAGLPGYTGLFGRDVLTAGWQSALLGPDIMRGALARLAAAQATADSAWHDAEPGKMVHEMRRGPLSELDVIPQRAYYGTQTSASMFVVILSELWHWTGDTDILRRYLEAALRACDWARQYGDRDGDGFLEYQKRSERGLKNQGWKDSDEALRYPNGELVDNPIATVEEQAYHCLALQRLAEILLVLGDDRQSAQVLDSARRLQARWHEAFWMPDAGFYAMALDAEKRQVQSIGSNPGHALAAGLVPLEFATAVANRLMAPDLFSGWAVRTLSADHPSYNPLAYHLGTAWPVENATFAVGFKRYGLDGHLERLVSAMMAAAGHFRHFRLPEAIGGHSREEAPIPTVYPESCSPQAWSASGTVQMAQALLGIYPFAPARVLALVRPALPAWLSRVTLHNLRVGTGLCSLHFERRADGTTSHTVLSKTGTLHVLEVPPPQDVERGHQRWRDVLTASILDHAPGRTARALRIALGDLKPS